MFVPSSPTPIKCSLGSAGKHLEIEIEAFTNKTLAYLYIDR